MSSFDHCDKHMKSFYWFNSLREQLSDFDERVCMCVYVCSATAENFVFQRVWVKSGSGDFHDSQVADVKVSGEITPDVWLLGKKNKVTSGANYCANAKDFKYRKVNTSFSLSLSGQKHVPVTTPCNDSSEADN